MTAWGQGIINGSWVEGIPTALKFLRETPGQLWRNQKVCGRGYGAGVHGIWDQMTGLARSGEAEGFLGSDACPLFLRPMKTELATKGKTLPMHPTTGMDL